MCRQNCWRRGKGMCGLPLVQVGERMLLLSVKSLYLWSLPVPRLMNKLDCCSRSNNLPPQRPELSWRCVFPMSKLVNNKSYLTKVNRYLISIWYTQKHYCYLTKVNRILNQHPVYRKTLFS